ncbi:MAG: AMP-binding protein, partial [Candidatus Dormibacteria bacterium]
MTLESIALRKRGVVYDFAGAVYESDDSVAIVWEYDRDLFDRVTVRRITDRFATILRTVANAPDTLIRDIGVEDDLTRTLLLEASRGASLPHRLPPVTELISKHAAAYPDSPAVEDDGAVLTCGELDARANRIAAAIRHVITAVQTPGEGPVAIWVSSTADLAITGLGVLRTGACCDALDWGLDPDRVRTALADDAARLLITTTRRRGSLGVLPIPVICMDVEHSGQPGGPRSALRPDLPALVLRTSGVEGPPRAVVVDHYMLSAAAYESLRGDAPRGDVLLSDARTAGHMLATLVTVLASGDTAVVAPQGEFATVIGSGRAVKSVAMTPTELARVLGHLDRTRTTPRVGALVLSGEVLPGWLVHRWREHAAGTRIVHQYGGAELGLAVSAGEIPPDGGGIVPTGRPTSGTRRYVLDDAARL